MDLKHDGKPLIALKACGVVILYKHMQMKQQYRHNDQILLHMKRMKSAMHNRGLLRPYEGLIVH